MKRNAFILALAAVLALCVAGVAAAQPGNMPGAGGMGYGGMGSGGGKGYGGMGYGGMWRGYQATPGQQEAFLKITGKYQPQFIKLADKLWAKRAQLNGALAQEKIDRKQAKAFAKEVGDLLAQSYELQVEMLADMREQGLSYFGMGMMHGGMMGGGMMDMMHGGMMGGMMNMMMGGGRRFYGGGQPGPGGYGYMQGQGMMQ